MARDARAGLQASIVSYVRWVTDPKRLKIFHFPNDVRHRVVHSAEEARASLEAWGVVTKEVAA